MALLDDVLGGWSGGILVGVGAAVLLPPIVPIAGAVLRPVATALVKGGLLIVDAVYGVGSEVSAQLSDLVSEARTPERSRARPAPAHH